ncbi:vWA domain-containing protein [Pengzhenrongella phosphoraccumulans]|uniref:vWA domain-containing protein n=1 Tax=Pengzhenrongella phosphoraccumulans TaxID=3114394 RepID=UPI0038903DD7
MQVTASLDVDVVAVETHDELNLLLELTAPVIADTQMRAPATLVVVLDRSGSMAGERLEGAQRALRDLVDRLDPADSFGLITFDDEAAVVIPAGPVKDKDRIKAAIDAVLPGGMTDLSAGYLRGLQEVRRVVGIGTSRVLLISDGHANAGITDPDRMSQVAAKAAGKAVSTTTLGFGLGYDESLLGAIARGGNGAELFAEDADTAIGLIAHEVDGLLAQSLAAASLLLRLDPAVARVRIANDLPTHAVPDGIMIELGGFLSGEQRKLVLTFAVPGLPTLGLASIATLELRYVTLPALVEETLTVPVHVNVVPGDQAAGRIPNPVVVSELVYLRAQASKREASRRLQSGDTDAALDQLRAARVSVDDAIASAPPLLAAELREESAMLNGLIDDATDGQVSRASKRMSADSSLKSRTRGRRDR